MPSRESTNGGSLLMVMLHEDHSQAVRIRLYSEASPCSCVISEELKLRWNRA